MSLSNRRDQRPNISRGPSFSLTRDSVRMGLVVASLVALLPLGWRVREVVMELDRERRAGALYAQGLTLHLQGRSSEAAPLFRQVIALAPLAVEAYGDLADAEVRQGNIDAGVQVYRRLLAIYPYMYVGSLHRQLGFIELRAGRTTDARDDLEQAVELDPRDWHAYFLLGHAYRRLGETEAARRTWQRVLSLHPDYQPAREQIGRLDE